MLGLIVWPRLRPTAWLKLELTVWQTVRPMNGWIVSLINWLNPEKTSTLTKTAFIDFLVLTFELILSSSFVSQILLAGTYEFRSFISGTFFTILQLTLAWAKRPVISAAETIFLGI